MLFLIIGKQQWYFSNSVGNAQHKAEFAKEQNVLI